MYRKLTEEQANYLVDLVTTYGDALKKYAMRFLGYKANLVSTAEDAVQETYFKAMQNIEILMCHKNPLGWLKVCLRYVLLNQLRSDKKREVVEPNRFDYTCFMSNAVDDMIERFHESQNLEDFVRRLESALSEDEKRIFADYFCDEMTTKETAMKEGVTCDTVRGRVGRIRKKLKKLFSSEYL